MDLQELTKLTLVSMVNQILSGKKFSELSSPFEILTGLLINQIHFVTDKNELSFEAWTSYLKSKNALRAFLSAEVPENHPKIGGELDERMLAAFAGVEESRLAIDFADHVEIYPCDIKFPRKSDLDVEDIISFIDQYQGAERQYFIDGMIWQNENNIHLHPSNDWDKIVASVKTPEQTETFVETFVSVVYNGDAPKSAKNKWSEIYIPDGMEKPLHFYYHQHTLSTKNVQKAASIAEAEADLCEKLEKIAVYAREVSAADWADFFKSCIHPSDPDLDSMLKPFFSADARKVILMLKAKTAFGGMGSWNDVPNMGEEEYKKVSDELFQAIKQAVISVAEHGTV